MKRDFPFVKRNYDRIVAGTNLFVETQHRHNPAIGNYLDAFYFTVAALDRLLHAVSLPPPPTSDENKILVHAPINA